VQKTSPQHPAPAARSTAKAGDPAPVTENTLSSALDSHSFEQLLFNATAAPPVAQASEETMPPPPGPAAKSVSAEAPSKDERRVGPATGVEAKKGEIAGADKAAGPPESRATEKAPTPSPVRQMKPAPAMAAPDPELISHLQWLRTFNNSFLKGYEAGNE
jgi:hypothetical protein